MAFVDGISPDFDEIMLRIGHVSEWNDEFAAINHIGSGWEGPDAVAMAIYCAIRYPDDYASAIRRAVNIPGDSDSVGSIIGGIMGARLGVEAIQPEWIARLEGLDRLTDVATRLATRKAALEQQA